jgi:molybdopterin synthase catalytic subunit
MIAVRIASDAIDPAQLQAAMTRDPDSTGALASFTGYVRGDGITAMALEHYPGMTERSIEDTIRGAMRRWPLQRVEVVHRVGELAPGDPIVWVAVTARHRAAAFSGCEYIMDYLKVSAPLWKRERDAAGEWHWVEARDRDRDRAQRWGAVSRPAAAGDARE